MSTIRELRDEALLDLQGTGFSRRWLWELIRRLELTVGSRVLAVGRRTSGLARFLLNLGIDAEGRNESTDRSTLIPGALELPARTYDAVIVGGLRVYQRPLNDRDVLNVTAKLLSSIRPGGRLVVVSGADGSLDAPKDHQAECFADLLRRFGTQVDVNEGRNLLRWAASLWSSESAIPSEWQVCFSLPEIAIESETWLLRAGATDREFATPCCDAWPMQALKTVA